MLTVSRSTVDFSGLGGIWDRPSHSGNVFCGFFGRNGRRVLWTKDEKSHPDCYQQQVQTPGSVMVWGCVSALGKSNLHFCDGTINAEKYIQMFGATYAAFKTTSFPGMRVLDWPACSPDLSLNVWGTFKCKMRQRRPHTVIHLQTCLQEEWDKITPETLHHLVSSVPKCLLSVVKRNGNITKW